MTEGLGDAVAATEGPTAGRAVATCTGRGSDRTYHNPTPATTTRTIATNPASSRRDSAASRSLIDSPTVHLRAAAVEATDQEGEQQTAHASKRERARL